MIKLFSKLNHKQKSSIWLGVVTFSIWLLIVFNGTWTISELKRVFTEPAGLLVLMILGSYLYFAYFSLKQIKQAFWTPKSNAQE